MNYSLTLRDIYDGTHDGRDIFNLLHPEWEDKFPAEGAGNGKKFALRPGEKTPSAHYWYVSRGAKYAPYWKIVDFGDKGMTAVEMWMEERGSATFAKALHEIAAAFSITKELVDGVNKAVTTYRDLEGESLDWVSFTANDGWSDDELSLWGPKVEPAMLERYGWISVKEISKVQPAKVGDDGKTRPARIRTDASSGNYPIWVRRCRLYESDDPKKGFGIKPVEGDGNTRHFFKRYEPLNTDKSFRFTYFPTGKKPTSYINGLLELKEEYDRINAEARSRLSEEEREGYKYKKVERVCICSGERDAMCCLSMGVCPIWLNSETADLTAFDLTRISWYAQTIYNIPDLDSTGIRQGFKLATRPGPFMNIRTVLLPRRGPHSAYGYKDYRGRSRKDLRDWMELFPSRELFDKLLVESLPATFWEKSYDEKRKREKYTLSPSNLMWFLYLIGICQLRDSDTKEARIIRHDPLHWYIVEEISAKDVKVALNRWAEETHQPRELKDAIMNTPYVSESSLLNLKEEELDFKCYTKNTQVMFFDTKAYEVTPTEVRSYRPDDVCVWRQNVVPLMINKFRAPFTIEEVEGEHWRISVEGKDGNVASPVMGYLINTSRLFWREEWETVWEQRDERALGYMRAHGFDSIEQARLHYHKTHRFSIDSELLSEEQRQAQMDCLANKLFLLGYYQHHYKVADRPWIFLLMDNKIGEDGQCNGGSGKSIMLNYILRNYTRLKSFDGRSKAFQQSQFILQKVTKGDKVMFFDDLPKGADMDSYYNIATGDLDIDVKGRSPYSIAFDESPKLACSTNYVPKKLDGSTRRRYKFCPFSDWYHSQSEETDYQENRTVSDDFGGMVLYNASYPTEMRQLDAQVMVAALQFYLRCTTGETVKYVAAPEGNILNRINKQTMGENFEDWANGFFAEERGNVNRLMSRQWVFEQCKRETGLTELSAQGFLRKLRAFIDASPHFIDYSPQQYWSEKTQRIIRRCPESKDKAVECLYMQTVGAQLRPVETLDQGVVTDAPF
ncbi:MAG: hypothetical protein HUK01_03685 [Bacteroidaceae bacterium]|nr:hypothetical protein [Bacteroidaceae bacterium]